MDQTHRVVVSMVLSGDYCIGTVKAHQDGEYRASSTRAFAIHSRDGLDELWESLDSFLAGYMATRPSRPPQLFGDLD